VEHVIRESGERPFWKALAEDRDSAIADATNKPYRGNLRLLVVTLEVLYIGAFWITKLFILVSK
jgi:hypothetical protein